MSDLDPRGTDHGRRSRGAPLGETAHETRRRVLAEVADVLSSTSDVESVLRGTAEAALRGLADHALIERTGDGRPPRRVILRAQQDRATRAWDLAIEAEEDDALVRCAQRAASTGELVREDGARPRVGAPIADESGIVGALSLGRASGEVAFDADDLALVREIARRAGIALRAARLLESLESEGRALRALDERYRLATQAIRGVVYEWDAATDEVAYSRGLLELAAIAASDARTTRSGWWRSRMHPGDRRRVDDAWRETIRTGGASVELVYRVRDQADEWRHVWDRALLVRDAGQRVLRAVGGLLDITDHVRAKEALERADRRKDELIALLGHELRGPLAAIAGAVEVLDRFATEDPRVTRAREVVRRQVATGTRLAEDLLDSSRIAQGKMTLRLESLDLAALVTDVVEDHRAIATHHGLALALDGAASPVRVHGDRTRLAQALGNLLHNAIKFSHPGGTIAVRVASDGSHATVVVRDDGVGIPPHMLERVFEPFAQAEVDPHRAGAGGLGLGLALVRAVVELHRGRVEARSEGRGRGTELRLELPIDASERVRTSSVPPPSHAPAVSVRVLVVEDDRDAAEMLQILLESDGHAVDIAANGPAALAAAERDAPDLVLCDLGLPGAMSGIEVASALRRIPRVSAAYLVALSGFGHDEVRERAVRASFDRHLTKPAELARLRECAALAAARRAPVRY